MSTKNSLVSGPNFHLYSEIFDEEKIYLKLENTEFKVSNNQIQIAIPIVVWEVLRQHTFLDLSKIYWTDEQLSELAERIVVNYSSNDLEKKNRLIHTASNYGDDNLSKNDRVLFVLNNLKIERENQRKLKDEIDNLESSIE